MTGNMDQNESSDVLTNCYSGCNKVKAYITTILKKDWWIYALRGLFALLFGLLAFIWPGLTLEIFIILFGIFVLLNGGCAISTAFKSSRFTDIWWVILLEGIVGVLVGIFAFVWPRVTAVILLIFIALWALITGIFEIFASVRLREAMNHAWVLTLAGTLSILLALILMLSPAAGILAAVWVIGTYAILYGVLMFYMAFRIYRLTSLLDKG